MNYTFSARKTWSGAIVFLFSLRQIWLDSADSLLMNFFEISMIKSVYWPENFVFPTFSFMMLVIVAVSDN